MASADPWPGQDDDTDYGYYDTSSGNIWCPDTAPAAGSAQPALPANARSGRGLAELGRRRRGADGWIRHRAGPAAASARPPSPAAGAAGTAAVLAATLGLAEASWPVAVWQMTGMDMGVATRLGSLGFFTAVWVAMMAAMMLPGAVPAVARAARAGGVRAVPEFAGSYLAVWALAGAVVFAAYRPDDTAGRRGDDPRGGLRAHAGQAALPPPLPADGRAGFRVWALLPGFQRRADGDAGGGGRDERDLDGRDRRPGHRQKLLPPRAAVDMPLRSRWSRSEC